jgi:hypothetical protein
LNFVSANGIISIKVVVGYPESRDVGSRQIGYSAERINAK